MTSVEIISLVVTAMGVCSFSAIFTILYRNYSAASIKEIVTGKTDIELIDEYIYNAKKNIERRREILSKVKTIAFYTLLALLVPVFIFAMISKFNNSVVMFGGKSLMVVASGSMSERNEANAYLDSEGLYNQFDTYDIIVLKKVRSDREIKKYDVIAFVNDEGINVIHRIRGFKGDKYVTRGDSNNADDKYNPSFEDVIGVYTGQKIPLIGIFVLFFQSPSGVVTVGALIFCLIMMDKQNKRIKDVQFERLKKLREAIGFDEKQASSKEFSLTFNQYIYYKGFAYVFDDEGFVEKREIAETNITEEAEGTMLKVVETVDGRTSEKIIIVSEEE